MTPSRQQDFVVHIATPSVETCIKYVLSCGFTLTFRNRNYGFKRGDWSPVFTLHEIREAYLNGF